MNPLFVVLTGLLGSGKTSLIERYVPTVDAGDTAVIVNDIAEMDIDGVIISSSTEVPAVTLSNGCICCSLASDLQITLTALLERRQQDVGRPFERIILECTGLADAGAVLRHIGAIGVLDMNALVVCTLACDQRSWQSEIHAIAVSQLACAQRVVLTKQDLVTSAEAHEQQDVATRLAPFATIIDEIQPDRRARKAFGDDNSAGHRAKFFIPMPSQPPRINHDIDTYVIESDRAQPWPVYADWFEDIAGAIDSRLLRLKGLLHTLETEQILLIQGVGRFFDHPRRLNASVKATSIVLITHNVKAEEVQVITQEYPGLRVSTS